jgi:hypothetical protein
MAFAWGCRRLHIEEYDCRETVPLIDIFIKFLFNIRYVSLITGLIGGLSWWVSATAAELSGQYDLTLVLAVDCSGSVSGDEFRLQMGGIAAAMRDPEVVAAALSGPNRQIALNVLLWGDPDYQKFSSGWYTVDSQASAEAFASMVQGFDTRMGGGTGLGIAVAYGISLLEYSGAITDRKVIDVSGDGIESYEIRQPRFQLKDAQLMRARAGVVINGLSIHNEDDKLATYYRSEVAAGPGSFVMDIATYDDFKEAIRLKLLREIRPLTAALETTRLR